MSVAETAILMVDIKVGQNELPAAAGSASRAVSGLEQAASRVTSSTSKLGGALSHAGSQLKGLVTGPAGLLGLGAGLFTVTGAIEKGIGRAQEFGDEVRRMSALTGLSTETTSALAAALDHYGVSADKAIRLTGFLEKNVGLLASRKGGIVGFEQDFGLSLRTANGHLKDANELILTTADYFNNKSIPATTKAAALAKLYGRSWQDLIPFLSAGRQGIKDAEEEAAKFGLTLTKDNIDALVKMKKATRDWGDALGGLELQIGLQLIPSLTELARSATKFVGENRTSIVQFFKDGAKFAGELGDIVTRDVLPMFGALKAGWDSIPGPFKDLLVKGLVADRTVKFLFGFSPITFAADALKGALGGLLSRGGSPATPLFVSDISGGLGKGVPGAGAGSGIGNALKFAAALGIGAVALDLWTSKLAPLNDAIAQQTRDIETNTKASFQTATLKDLQAELSASVDGLNEFHKATDALGPLQEVLYGSQKRTLEENILAIKREIAARDKNSTTFASQGHETAATDRADKQSWASINGWTQKTATGITSLRDALHRDLQESLHAIRHGNDPAKIAAAVRHVVADVTKGAGSTKGTEHILAELNRRLGHTHDPQLQAVLRAAIHSVEAKLPNRRFVEGQYQAAIKIERSSERAKDKITDLAGIQRTLLARGDVHAAARIGKDIQVLRDRMTNKADRGNTLLAGIKAKKTEFTTNLTVNTAVAVSVRDFESKQRSLSRMKTTSI